MSKYIDIGANLHHPQFSDLDKVLTDSKTGGVNQIIITGTNSKRSFDADNLVSKYIDPKYPVLYSTAGVHPHDASREITNKNCFLTLEKLLNKKTVVAVGECGLDYNRMFSTKEDQISMFIKQIELAIAYDKPLFLHERDAFDDFYNILKKYEKNKLKGVVHCFTGTKANALKYLELGYYIGLTGFICDNKRNRYTLEALKVIPIDRLLIETDAPFMNPIPHNGTNYPSNVKYVLEENCQREEYGY